MIERYFTNDGNFEADGITLDRLLRDHTTPLYLYSAGVISDKFQRFTSRFPGFDVFYSFKANPNLAICRRLLGLGACADVSSMGELRAALRVGFKPENIAFVGPGKTPEEIELAIETGIYALAVESSDELEIIESLCRKLRKRIDVLLRINTREEPIAPEMMVGGPSKFGFDEERVVEEVQGVALDHARISGIHVYSASQVLDDGFISRHLEYVCDLAVSLAKELGFELRCVDFGGGFGVPYLEGDEDLDLASIGRTAGEVRAKIKRYQPGCRLIFEVGRFLVAEAGVFVSRVIRVKQSRGKTFIICDGGMNHFTRPAFLRFNHQVRILNKISKTPDARCSIGGPICTPLDIIARDVLLPAPDHGDIVGIFNAGAYGYTMSMINFMSLGWPAEVMADEGAVHIIRQARPAADLFDTQPRIR